MRRDDGHPQDGHHVVRRQAARARRRRRCCVKASGARPGGDGDRGLRPDRRRALRAELRAHRLPQRLPHPTGGTPGSARSSSRSPRSPPAPTSPRLLEPRRRAEKALHAVVVEAYVKGVSTRKVDDLVRALGIDGISRSEVSRICKALDDEVRAFLGTPDRGRVPLPLARRDVPQGPRGRPGDLGGHRRRDRGHGNGRAHGARSGDRSERGPPVLDLVPARASSSEA